MADLKKGTAARSQVQVASVTPREPRGQSGLSQTPPSELPWRAGRQATAQTPFSLHTFNGMHIHTHAHASDHVQASPPTTLRCCPRRTRRRRASRPCARAPPPRGSRSAARRAGIVRRALLVRAYRATTTTTGASDHRENATAPQPHATRGATQGGLSHRARPPKWPVSPRPITHHCARPPKWPVSPRPVTHHRARPPRRAAATGTSRRRGCRRSSTRTSPTARSRATTT